MMKIKKVVKNLILLVLDNHETLKKIGISQDQIFVKVEDYDFSSLFEQRVSFN